MKRESKLQLSEMLKQLPLYTQEMNILYVEDEQSIREITQKLLLSIFPSVVTAEDGKEGLELFKNTKFDIVISDILMPKMNGITMVKKIKEINNHQSIIITSACDDSSYLLELINLGISNFILKPMQSQQILQTLWNKVMSIYNEKRVREMNQSLENELVHKSTLLEQYKEVVDISTIVSKTDIHGRITYVNEKFCNISGFKSSELIGKKHNIIRHPDLPKEFFSNLWETILAKKIWNGVVKNKKKNGDYYITDSTIKPILDKHGEIIEFMSIRHDVTELFDLNEEISRTQHEMLYLLGEVGETRSEETGNHVRRVAEYSKLLGELYGLDKDEISNLYTASPMHDIGKIGISDAILLKPGKLDDAEYEIMKQHAKIGFDMFKNSERPILKAAAIIAYEHHEKWDGTGYPRSLAKDEIHIYGRITALTDVFDALSCERVYKKPWPMEQILELLKEERGKHFDPTLVDLFFQNIEKFKEIGKNLR